MIKPFLALSVIIALVMPLYAWDVSHSIPVTVIFAIAGFVTGFAGYRAVGEEPPKTLDEELKQHQWSKH